MSQASPECHRGSASGRRAAIARAASAFAFTLLLAACGADATQAPSGEADDVTSTPTLKTNLPGFTVWIDQAMHPDHRFDTDVWVVHGRTSKNITAALAFVSDDEYGDTEVLSPRVFELTFDSTTAPGLLEGSRLFVRLDVEGAATPYIATMTFQPKLRSATGGASIDLSADLEPVLVAGAVDFRGSATLGKGLGAFAAADATGPALAVAHPSPYHYTFDFGDADLLVAAHGSSPLVKLTAKRAGSTVEKDATLAFEATSLAMTQSDPFTTFPEPPCDPAVDACLAALPAGQTDFGSCGTYHQVIDCQQQPTFQVRFARDLSAALGPWYAQHPADVAGGNTLEQAIASVLPGNVTEVTADDPHGHDLTAYRVMTHPDVVFPGGPRRWFGAYDRSTNVLSEVYDFE